MDTQNFKDRILRLFPDFKKSNEFVEELLAASNTLDVPAGASILDTGDYIKVIPFLVSGLIKIYRVDAEGNEILLYYINSGESCIISITASLKNEKSSIKAYIEEDSTILAVPNNIFEKLLGKYNLLHNFTYDLFSSKYNQLLESIDNLVFTDMRSRLINYLKTESEVKNTRRISGLTHKKIAHDLSTSREVISRLMSALNKEKLLMLDGRTIVLGDEL